MINKEVLKQVGLTENEAEIYLTLLKLGEVSIYKIAEHCKISRPNIYDIVKILVKKGLATFIIKNNKKYYRSVAPEKLLEIIKEKEKNLLDILAELNKIYETTKVRPVIEIFEEVEGLKTIMNDVIKVKKDIWIFSGVDINKLLKKFPEYYLKRMLREKKKHKIKTRILYSRGTKPIKGWGYELKRLPEEGLDCVSYFVYDNRTVIGIWGYPMILIRIISNDVAKVYQKSIELIWKSIK